MRSRRAARRVQGLYTVPVVDADLRADEPWLATAYVPGPSLQDAVDEYGPLPVDAARGLIARVAEALRSIHSAELVFQAPDRRGQRRLGDAAGGRRADEVPFAGEATSGGGHRTSPLMISRG